MPSQMERPLWEMLQAVAPRLSLHMPAGQGHGPFGEMEAYRLDTTELPVTDDLYAPSGAIARAQALAARSAGAKETLLLHGGSTTGIHGMLMYAARRGEKVILPRNVHVSALNACAVAGLEPVFALPSFLPSGRPYTPARAYEEAMENHPDAKAVLVLRPDYYGFTQDFSAISQSAHRRGMLVLCDEAHGAYFNWRSAMKNAGDCGADLFVQSAHKTLPALTAGAWLHAGEGVDVGRLRRILRMAQTSSPSFLSMCSLDDARAWMDIHGEEAATRLEKAIRIFHERVASLGFANGQTDAPEGFEYDCLRLVLRAPQGGYALARALSERGMDVEMSDEEHIVCILSLIDGQERLKKLEEALLQMDREERTDRRASAKDSSPCGLPPQTLPERALLPWEAAFAPCQAVPMEEAVGRICATQVGLYPPGIALCVAGEVLCKELIVFLKSVPKERIFGLPCAGRLLCVTIEDENSRE